MEAVDFPWYFNLLWPAISTALTAVLRVVFKKLKDKLPPVVWPVFNAVTAALLAAIAATSNPAELVNNVVTAVLAALGLNKAVDLGKGKTAAITANEKRIIRGKYA